MLIEIIATSLEEAIAAEKFGAGRIELIHSFDDGGLSPNLELAKNVCANVSIPVNVMVRPHAKSFLYDKHDLYTILEEIDFLLSHTKINGVVFGCLDSNRRIDAKTLEAVIKFIDGKADLTFHRAIDESADPVIAFSELQSYGCSVNNVLSSGGKATAMEGINTLQLMQEKSCIGGAKLLPGSGVNPQNASILARYLNVCQLHIGTGVRVNNKLEQSLFNELFIQLQSL
ncbi:copper homeostasis protein CutC [Aquella oligotrophica]|uniref:Copper homeostasis protein cutC homolog n=1 Tax=Aquella oligotrophica TaxID=2067065 RepID=A0A2I7N4Y4_9NEIS|nr:copper homeostasis protein CutC [Aquella oligotrophica]AUR51512.1 copper homeostasis protein [Aquella oligotrophica]